VHSSGDNRSATASIERRVAALQPNTAYAQTVLRHQTTATHLALFRVLRHARLRCSLIFVTVVLLRRRRRRRRRCV
jgi:hypothetical protein